MSEYFDILIIPEHDNFHPKNINIKTIGSLSFFKEKDIKKFFQPIKNTFKKFLSPNILLLLGGQNKRYSPTLTEYYKLLKSVKKAAERISGNIIICPSRRTAKIVPYIASLIFSDFKFKKYISSNNVNDIYPGVLEISDYVIVTSDSVNMISEIASTSKNLYIANFSNNDLKLKSFHKKIIDLGIGKFFNENLENYNKKKLDNEKTINKNLKKFRKIFKTLSK